MKNTRETKFLIVIGVALCILLSINVFNCIRENEDKNGINEGIGNAHPVSSEGKKVLFMIESSFE